MQKMITREDMRQELADNRRLTRCRENTILQQESVIKALNEDKARLERMLDAMLSGVGA